MKKKLLLLALSLLVITPAIEAKRKVEKAGEVKDGIYLDNTYGFSFKVLENWNVKIGKEKEPFRIILTQQDWSAPTHFINTPDYTKIPKMVVFVGETKMGVMALLDSLVSREYDSELKSEVLKEFEFLHEDDATPRGKKPVKLDGLKAARWDGRAKYVQEVQLSASSVAGKRVNGSFGGSLIGVKKGDTIILFHVMCEWDFFEPVMSEVMNMIDTFNWSGEKEKEKEEE